MVDYVVIGRRNDNDPDYESVAHSVKHTLEDAIVYAKHVAEYERAEEMYYEVYRVIPLTGAQGGRKRFRYVEPPVQARVEEF